VLKNHRRQVLYRRRQAGYPALLFNLAAEERQYQFTFNPASLRNAQYVNMTLITESRLDLMLGYLRKYSDCFVLRQLAKRSLLSPNEFSRPCALMGMTHSIVGALMGHWSAEKPTLRSSCLPI
jgi:hypothetical protein